MIDDKFAAYLPRVKGNMVKYTPMKISLAMAVIVAASVALADWRTVVPPVPGWVFDAGWNMLRVTRRGEGSDSDQAECIVRHGFLYISVR